MQQQAQFRGIGIGIEQLAATAKAQRPVPRRKQTAQAEADWSSGSQQAGEVNLNLLAADHLVAVVLAGENLERRLNDTAAQTQNQVKGGLLLDVVVAQGAAILQLLASKDETLLVRGDAYTRHADASTPTNGKTAEGWWQR